MTKGAVEEDGVQIWRYGVAERCGGGGSCEDVELWRHFTVEIRSVA